jgi:hypothetical protein
MEPLDWLKDELRDLRSETRERLDGIEDMLLEINEWRWKLFGASAVTSIMATGLLELVLFIIRK